MSVATATNLKVVPGVESLAVSWTATGSSIGGWLLHFRQKGATAWTTVRLQATVSSYAITGLKAVGYEVQVRALVAGGLASTTATPLAPKPVEPPVEPPAPMLSASGNTLSWPALSGVSEYELAVVRNPGTTRVTTYEPLTGTSVTPPVVPGETVNYGCRAFTPPSRQWAKEVSITYPPAPAGLLTGLVVDSDGRVPSGVTPKVLRVEYGIGTVASMVLASVKSYAAKGIKVQPLAGAQGRICTAAEAKNLGSWATACKGLIDYIELENETNYQIASSFGHGEEYGRRAKEAAEAMAGSGVGLLIQGSDAGTRNTEWLDGIFKAVPNITSFIAGWTIHPYWGGPTGKEDTFGEEMMERLVKRLVEHGDSKVRIFATEWGVPSDNGVTFTSLQKETYAEAGQIIERHPAELQKAAQGRLAELLLYQCFDQAPPKTSTDREKYFGVVTSAGGPKGAMTTAAEAFLA